MPRYSLAEIPPLINPQTITIMDSLGSAISHFFASRAAYVAVSQQRSDKETRDMIQERMVSCLNVVHHHLGEYVATLDRIATRLEAHGVDAVWDMRKNVIEVIEEYERLRIDHWLAFYLAIIDEDTSSADVLPATLDEVHDLLNQGKLCFRKLPDEEDTKRRECAMRTAEIYSKHAEIAAQLSLPDLEQTIY